MAATEFVTLSAAKRALGTDGVQWVDYHAEAKRGTNSIDWAVIQQHADGTYDGSRLYHTTAKTGDASLTIQIGETVTAFVVELLGGGYAGQQPISNPVSVTG